MLRKVAHSVFLFAALVVSTAGVSAAHAFEWQVLPSQCIVSSASESCKTEVRVTLTGLTQPVCVVANNSPQQCLLTEKNGELIFALDIYEDVLVQAFTPQGKVIKSKTIPFQIIESKPKRRRVRLPWSFF